MNGALRLIGYTRRYTPLVVVSVILMAVVGAMTAARTLLIKPVLGRVLRPSMDGPAEPLFVVPVINKAIWLENMVPASIHNIFTIVAIAIVVVFALRGIYDYLGDYITNFVGFSVVRICATTCSPRCCGTARRSSKRLRPAR